MKGLWQESLLGKKLNFCNVFFRAMLTCNTKSSLIGQLECHLAGGSKVLCRNSETIKMDKKFQRLVLPLPFQNQNSHGRKYVSSILWIRNKKLFNIFRQQLWRRRGTIKVFGLVNWLERGGKLCRKGILMSKSQITASKLL